MYNKYLALLEAEELKNAKRAIAIANNEILNRPTPQSYDLLAWAYYQDGKPKKALEIAKTQLENKTFEPESLYHLGIIYQANGERTVAKKYLQEALDSRFELGPSISHKIQRRLKEL
jgi:tetratricopeptide (TPR) repeat protein